MTCARGSGDQSVSIDTPRIASLAIALLGSACAAAPDAEVSDHDGDGRVDSLRVADPPGTYRHLAWFDEDRDGFFDYGPPWNERAPSPDPRWRVPVFAGSDDRGDSG